MYILHRMFQNFIDKLPEQFLVEEDVPCVACVYYRHLLFLHINFPQSLVAGIASGFRHSDVVEACQGILKISYNVNFILCIHSDIHNGV